MWPYRRQPTRLPRPWDSPGKNTGVGCHFLLQCIKVKSEREVAELCPTLSDPMDWAHQAPLSMGFSRQEYWSGVPLPSPKWLATWTKSSFILKSENLGDWRPPFRGRSDPLGSQLPGREGWSKESKGGDNGTEADTVVKLIRGTPWVGGECKLKQFCWHNHRKAGQLTSNPALTPTLNQDKERLRDARFDRIYLMWRASEGHSGAQVHRDGSSLRQRV